MVRNIAALIAGIVFSLGLVISQMVNPAKVIAFLDISGNWDPSLGIVMGSALVVTAIGYQLAWRREKPFYAAGFQVPANRKIDQRLAIGAVLFGIGWGLAGLCPGPSLAALAIGGLPALGFFAAMLLGMAGFEIFDRVMRRRNATES